MNLIHKNEKKKIKDLMASIKVQTIILDAYLIPNFFGVSYYLPLGNIG